MFSSYSKMKIGRKYHIYHAVKDWHFFIDIQKQHFADNVDFLMTNRVSKYLYILFGQIYSRISAAGKPHFRSTTSTAGLIVASKINTPLFEQFVPEIFQRTVKSNQRQILCHMQIKVTGERLAWLIGLERRHLGGSIIALEFV